jgi:exopolysaccharide biosynthesis polyprenyl glycosylphosphotransferase
MHTGDVHMIHILAPPLAGWPGLVKRIEDIAVAVLALIVFALPMALIALAIRIDSPGPILFRQYRTGFNNRDFRMLKFRTMHHHLADHAARTQATRHDPRVTRLGAVLRRTSWDELPLIFNVLRGEMSFVGPRPHAPGTRAGGRPFDQVVAHYAARHRVRPGMTGLAQVRGLRGETETEDKLVRRVDSDLEYIENWSLWLDLVVLARTAAAVLGMQNAY